MINTPDRLTRQSNYSTAQLFDRSLEHPPREVFTEVEAAKWLRISKPTLQRIRLRGEISFARVGGTRVIYRLSHLQAYLDSREIAARRS